MHHSDPSRRLAHSVVVTASQMQQIEARLFANGMPVAALMEKVAGLMVIWLTQRFPRSTYPRIGVLVGPGHNGGDALVVARELQVRGYQVVGYVPFQRQKDLTAAQGRYVASLGIPLGSDLAPLQTCDLLIDGLFGFGLERPLTGAVAEAVDQVNRWTLPVVSIDLPSGLHTDTAEVLGTAIRATHTLCLGLWKRACFQDRGLAWLGQSHLIDFHIPQADLEAVLGTQPTVRHLTLVEVQERLPLPRPADSHKYRAGQLLVIAGSRPYAGAAQLAGLGARASGVGMVTLAVPESLRLALVTQQPEALVVGCPETERGAIADLPEDLDLNRYDAIACGPGLSPGAAAVLAPVLNSSVPLVLDADGLNLLAAQAQPVDLSTRSAPTLLTPHPGEFKRLFPQLLEDSPDPGTAAQRAAHRSKAVILLKGARPAIATPDGALWLISDGSPALARGGSGDVLTGLAGGLLAQAVAAAESPTLTTILNAALTAAWWHGQTGRVAATQRTELGVDPVTLAQMLSPTLAEVLPR